MVFAIYLFLLQNKKVKEQKDTNVISSNKRQLHCSSPYLSQFAFTFHLTKRPMTLEALKKKK